MWDAGFDANPEADDYLHNPDPKRDRKVGLLSFCLLSLSLSPSSTCLSTVPYPIHRSIT